MALYGNNGCGDLITSFKLAPTECEGADPGHGVTQVEWSPCGRYLFLAERQSNIIELYDVRQAGRRLGWLEGRKAETKVKLSFDVVPTAQGLEVWAGGIDGRVRMWGSPEQTGGPVNWDEQWQVHGGEDCSGLQPK